MIVSSCLGMPTSVLCERAFVKLVLSGLSIDMLKLSLHLSQTETLGSRHRGRETAAIVQRLTVAKKLNHAGNSYCLISLPATSATIFNLRFCIQIVDMS